MKLHIYKNTPFGIERVNEHSLTIEEAKAVLKVNPSLTARDAESASYEVLHMPPSVALTGRSGLLRCKDMPTPSH